MDEDRKMKLKLKILAAVFAMGVVIMCFIGAAPAVKKSGNSKKQDTVKADAKKQPEDPRIEKLNLVLSKMTPRFRMECKETILADKEAFLSELETVLADEDNYPSNEDPSSKQFFLIDKKHKAQPEMYEPYDLIPLVKNNYFNISRNDLRLRSYVYDALVEMAKGARQDGITLLVSSTYRSWEYQKNLFQKWVRIDGLEEAERESAREGTSQHQLGFAIDFGSIDDSFIQTSQGKWLDSHCEDYGWSLSFPQGYEDVTGYRWECWHYRYIGIPACKFQNKWFNDIQQFMFEFIDAWKNN